MITSSDVLNEISQVFNISIDDLKTKVRYDELIFPRKVFMYVCFDKLNMKMTDISRKLNREITFAKKGLKMINRHIINNEPKWIDAWSRYEKESKILKTIK